MPAPDVLIVEDNRDLIEALVLILEDAGFATRTAGDGQQALDAVEARKPALVLLDMLMPVMDGWTCARILRERYGATIPIVVLTAAEHARLRADEIGADAVLPKPVDIDTLISVVGRYAPREAQPVS